MIKKITLVILLLTLNSTIFPIIIIDGAKNSNTNPTNFVFVAKNLEVPVGNTLTLDKPINLENNDILRVTAEPSPDSSSVDVEAFASILAMTE